MIIYVEYQGICKEVPRPDKFYKIRGYDTTVQGVVFLSILAMNKCKLKNFKAVLFILNLKNEVRRGESSTCLENLYTKNYKVINTYKDIKGGLNK